MSRTIFKKVSTYTRMGCDTLALDFSYKILYTTLIFIYKNLNIHLKLTCSWQYKNATASCRQNLRIFKTTSHEPIVLKLGQLQVVNKCSHANLSQPVLIPDPMAIASMIQD